MTGPLAEIEKAVQQRAADLPAGRATRDALRALAEDEVARWGDDHRRGLRPFALADPGAMVERAVRNLAGYGPLEALLDDDDVWEVMINGPASIFVKRHRGPSGYHHDVFADDDHVVRTLTRILDEAGGAHRKLDPAEGLQDAQLESGARLHIVHGDIGRDGHMLVNIRKFTGVSVTRLDDLVDRGMLDSGVAAFLRAAVRGRLSVVFAGAPGAGKTTLLSCCAAELDPALRVTVAEEVFEADVPLPNVASMQTRPARPDRPAVDLRRLVAGFLRMAPDVAIVGEVRDREALPLLLTLSSGVTGYTTVHAASARQALSRLRLLCQLGGSGADLPFGAITALVSESVDVVVHCTRDERPEVSEVLVVEDLQSAPDSGVFTTTSLFARPRPGAPVAWTGALPGRAAARLEAAGWTAPRPPGPGPR